METRYDRQILLDEIGIDGQRKLKNAKVLIIGAGGLGSPVITYLASAGVGFLRIIEQDIVSISNLNRQFIYNEEQIGLDKSLMTIEYIKKINPHIKVEALKDIVTSKNIDRYLKDIDIVVDCVDNSATRVLVNKKCILNNITLIEGGVDGFYGFATVVTKDFPCLECMGIKEVCKPKSTPVLGTTAGIIGLIEANECIKYILGMKTLVGTMLQYDGYNMVFKKIPIKINPKCSVHNSLNLLH